MMKYLVVALRFNTEKMKPEKYIAGAFPDYTNAKMFSDAYNDFYSVKSEIIESNELLNRVD